MNRLALTICASALLAASASTGVARADDWPNFRGPNHDGICRESGLRTDFAAPPKTLWQRDLGSGFSSFAVVGDRVFTAGTQNDQQVVYCLNAASGEPIWTTPIERAYPESQGGDGPRATPTVHDGRVYMLGARGRLACLDAGGGEVLWDRQFGDMPTWGFSGSVLIEGDMAIVSAGGSDGALAAFDRKSGEPVWKSGDDPVSYATPYPFTHDGVRYIAGFLGDSAIVSRADDGAVVWRMPWKTAWNVNASAPIYHDGRILFSSGYKHGAIVLALTANSGKLDAREVWQGEALRNKFQSCVLDGDVLYTCDETGLKCVEFRTGKVRWHERRDESGGSYVHGTLVMAQGMLFILTESGSLIVGAASPDGFKPLARHAILSPRCWTVPVIANGRMYVRNLDKMLCLDLR